jgi:hypothetical protein
LVSQKQQQKHICIVMASFVVCPLVVVPAAVVGYYYGKHTEKERHEREHHEALWYLGKEETLHDYNTLEQLAHSRAPVLTNQQSRLLLSSPSVVSAGVLEAGEEIDLQGVVVAAAAATTAPTLDICSNNNKKVVSRLVVAVDTPSNPQQQVQVQEHPREPSEPQQQGEEECREAAATTSNETEPSISEETRDAEVTSTTTDAVAVDETTEAAVEVEGEVEDVDDFVLASEIASEEMTKLSLAAVAATEVCRASFVKAVDGATQELRRLEQAAMDSILGASGVLAGATAGVSSTSTPLDTTTTVTKNDKTTSFRTMSSWQKDEKNASFQQHQQDDISLVNFEMVKNPTMEEEEDETIDNKENNITGDDDIMLLHRNVTVKAVHKSVRDLELTYKAMTSASLVEI